MNKSLIALLLCAFNCSIAISQVNSEIMRKVNSNIEGFELYKFFEESESIKTEIIVDEIEGIDLQCQLLYDKLPVDIQYPDLNVQLFAFRKKGLTCGEITKTKQIYDGREYNIFLIGIDTSTVKPYETIKYISGRMFLDNISYDFHLDNSKPATFIEYIKLKMFSLQIDQLKFLNKKDGLLIYQAYSNIEDKELQLSVDINSSTKKIKIEKWL
jgi:hypothetical protein